MAKESNRKSAPYRDERKHHRDGVPIEPGRLKSPGATLIEELLADLNRSWQDGRKVPPNGRRYIFGR
jgi:hypothetical protein